MSENYQHLEWITSVVSDLCDTKVMDVSPEWDSRESYISYRLIDEASNFANFSSSEKRDIFIYLLGRIVETD